MNVKGSFGDWLRERRKALDLTQADLADQVGCSITTIRKIEADERRPSRQISERMADVLAISLEERAAFVNFARQLSNTIPSLPEAAAVPVKINHLPIQETPFIGREDELSQLAGRLADPTCRLLTLVGPGGIGKTRLALQAAADTVDEFADGVYFVSLTPVGATTFVASAIASALQFSLSGHENPEAQITYYLRGKHLLLLLDNFEHLLENAELLSEILKAAPAVRILVTSRERLNLREEWVFDVRELHYPANEAESDIENYDAVQLFLQHARRVHLGFVLTPRQKPAVIRICRLVGGMPLGIELAAAWVRVLSCEAIAEEIGRSMDILESSARNIEDRHRTMRAAFEPIWKRLPVEQSEVFKKLSVFRGGFTREAAEQVADASLRALSALVDKCLIQRQPDGRYQMHPLLRQYAEERLSKDAGEIQRAYDAHAVYYTQLLKQRELDLFSTRQRETVEELEADIDNIRAAWQWAVDEANVVILQNGAYSYYALCDMQGRYLESSDALEKAIARLESIDGGAERDFTLAILQNGSGGYLIRLGRLEEAQIAYQKSLTLYQHISRRHPSGIDTDPLANLGLLAVIVGSYDKGAAYGEAALKRIESGDQLNLMYTLYVLATATYSQGQPEAALGYARKAYAISDGLGDKYFSSYVLVVMGNIAQALEEYDKAWEYYQTSYERKKEANELGGMAFALNCMARIAWLRQDYPPAQKLFQQAHDLYRDVHDPGGLATSIFGLGDIAQAQADYATARHHFYRALEIAIDMRWTPLILAILAGISNFLLKTGEDGQAPEILALVAQHPASEPPTRRRAEQLLRQTKPRGDIPNRGDLDAAAQRLCAQLKLPKEYTVVREVKQHAVDVLSEREIEILRLLAEGRTNLEIAEKLILAVGTVKAHNNHIFSKLAVSNRVQAIVRARELGLI